MRFQRNVHRPFCACTKNTARLVQSVTNVHAKIIINIIIVIIKYNSYNKNQYNKNINRRDNNSNNNWNNNTWRYYYYYYHCVYAFVSVSVCTYVCMYIRLKNVCTSLPNIYIRLFHSIYLQVKQ